MRSRVVWVFVWAAVGMAGCAGNPLGPETDCCAFGVTISDRLYFGRDIQGRDSVTEANWTQFQNEVVAPAFPDEGWTVYRVEGHWRDATLGLIREHTFVLERVHVLTPRADSLMLGIARSYLTRFQQAAVLRVRTPASSQLIE